MLAKFSSVSKPTVFLVGDAYKLVEKVLGLSFPSLPRVVREGENSTEATLGWFLMMQTSPGLRGVVSSQQNSLLGVSQSKRSVAVCCTTEFSSRSLSAIFLKLARNSSVHPVHTNKVTWSCTKISYPGSPGSGAVRGADFSSVRLSVEVVVVFMTRKLTNWSLKDLKKKQVLIVSFSALFFNFQRGLKSKGSVLP